MSLVPTYVKADDGFFYKDPIVRGQHSGRHYFICFDDDDPPELVIQRLAIDGQKPAVLAAYDLLTDLGLDADISYNSGAHRVFRVSRREKFFAADAWFLKLKHKWPARLFVGYLGRPEPKGQCTVEQAGW